MGSGVALFPGMETENWVYGGVAAALGGLSFHKRCRRAYLGTVLVGVWLMVGAYRSYPEVASPAEQNEMICGTVLWLLALVPSGSTRSPKSWEQFLE